MESRRAGLHSRQQITQGMIADQIIKLAKENDVYVYESKEMVALLMQVDLDQEISPSLYKAVAELLSWLYKIEKIAPPSL